MIIIMCTTAHMLIIREIFLDQICHNYTSKHSGFVVKKQFPYDHPYFCFENEKLRKYYNIHLVCLMNTLNIRIKNE